MTAEELAAAEPATFDAVICSEVIEHVRRPPEFVQSLSALARPGGAVVLSTISRTVPSYALAVLGAEYVLRLVPAGTHDWSRFVTPGALPLLHRH